MSYRIELEKYAGPSSRYTCPSCNGKKEFTRYIDTETGEHIADHVGKCNREKNCDYHYTPKEYFRENPNAKFEGGTHFKNEADIIEPPKPIDYISKQIFQQTFNSVMQTNLAKFFIQIIGHEQTKLLFDRYHVARSNFDNGTATLFWRVDVNGNIRQGKVIPYHAETGKRKRKPEVTIESIFISGPLNTKRKEQGLEKLNLQQCLFGEHLLSIDTSKPVGLVESEKTALIASLYMPDLIWIATGGKDGVKWVYEVYKVLANRTVIFFPDFDWSSIPKQITCFENWSEKVDRLKDVLPGNFKVSSLLEQALVNEDRANKKDLADVLLKTDADTGHALNEQGSPLFWDLVSANFKVNNPAKKIAA